MNRDKQNMDEDASKVKIIIRKISNGKLNNTNKRIFDKDKDKK